MKIPPSVQSMLWDVAPDKVDLQRHQRFVISRIAEKGRWSDVVWLRKMYPLATIKRVVLTSKNTTARVKNFWEKL